ncbi:MULTISPECIES: ABC transporter permease [unclassified Curtobacterium]|uniref:ABC transporter permease n=1 Tax=unclassified Curtobacterium TaxID=257496 RepID=UPI000D94437E|nr:MULTISPECIES: ABC transporter permease [unclassified Curtobacterium]PYY65056.1 ABC transporter permease [Curtobacterium sp. MCPF17_003]WIB71790.1 ABC transporter permease [Curtobacterium sp. MCBD17_026]
MSGIADPGLQTGAPGHQTAAGTERVRGGTLGAGGIAAGVVVLVAVVAAAWPALLGGGDPLAVHPADALAAPSGAHPFGTDESGRDVLARVVAGTRASLVVGVAATLIGGGVGVLLGVVAGLGAGAGRPGRLLDAVIGRVTEVAFALPLLLVALVVIAVTGPGPVPAVLAVGFATAPGYARIVRGLVRTARSSQVVETAVLLGRSPARTVVRHVLPTALWPVVAVATLGVGQAVVWASALSYLGVGTPPPAPEWGAMLADGRTYLQTAPWMSTFPGLAIVVLATAVTVLGRAIRRTGATR